MKLIKKIAAIMFAFMMVVSMSCNVKADEGTTATGTITINNAIPEQTYKLYRLLDLESYSVNEDGQKENGNYSYKPASNWKTFLEGDGIKDVYFTFENGYASWKKDANVETFAKLAIEHANKENQVIEADYQQPAPTATGGQTTSTVTFDNLPLGYYLVDSSVGTLCSLDTTKPTVEIKEKNGVPSVDKKVSNSKNGTFDTSSTASIGNTVYFKTTITAQPGAQNYVLHDKMDAGLTFNESSVKAILNKNETKKDTELTGTDYSVVTSDLEDSGPKCTFHIEFTPKLCESLKADDTITVTYSATLNDKAVIGSTGNVNETKLRYGDSKETTETKTHTFTYDIPVFKYTMKDTEKKPLEHAKFTLSLKEDGSNPIKFRLN